MATGSASFGQVSNSLAVAVAEALADFIGSHPSVDIRYGSAEGGADIVVVSNVVIDHAQYGGLILPEVAIVSPVLRAEGGFVADRITFNGGEIELNGVQIGGWGVASFEPAIIPTPREAANLTAEPWPGAPETIGVHIREISVLQATMDRVDVTSTWTAAAYSVSGFILPLAALGDEPGVPALAMLGLTAIRADLDARATIDYGDERMAFQATLSVPGIIDIDLSLNLLGLDRLMPSPIAGIANAADARDEPALVYDPLLASFTVAFIDRGLAVLPTIGSVDAGYLAGPVNFVGALQTGFRRNGPVVAATATPSEPVRMSVLAEAGEIGPAAVIPLLNLRLASGSQSDPVPTP